MRSVPYRHRHIGIPVVAFLTFALACGVFAQRQPGAGRRAARFSQGPKAGSAAPDFVLKTIDDKTICASTLWSNKPTVIMTGSYTCPVFRGQTDAFGRLARDFSNQVNFVILYTQEAHPKGDPSPYTGREWTTPGNERKGISLPQPKTAAERVQHARTCANALKLAVPVAVDKMDNSAWKAYGAAPNSACLVGRDGKVIEQEQWFDPSQMRTIIERCLKHPSPPTN